MNKKYIPLICTIITILGNYLIPLAFGKSVGYVSDEYELQITPSGYTFSIWGLIYLGLLFVGIQLVIGNLVWNNVSTIVYALSCLLNCTWIFLWVNEMIVPACIVIYSLVISLAVLWYLNLSETANISQNIIATYVGWLLGASVLNTGIVIKTGSLTGIKINNDVLSKYLIYVLCGIQILWQLLQFKRVNASNSLVVPIVGLWTAIGILSNGKRPMVSYLLLATVVLCMLFNGRILGYL